MVLTSIQVIERFICWSKDVILLSNNLHWAILLLRIINSKIWPKTLVLHNKNSNFHENCTHHNNKSCLSLKIVSKQRTIFVLVGCCRGWCRACCGRPWWCHGNLAAWLPAELVHSVKINKMCLGLWILTTENARYT